MRCASHRRSSEEATLEDSSPGFAAPLEALLDPLGAVPPLAEAATRLGTGERLALGLADGAKAAVVASLQHGLRRPTLLLVPRERDAEGYAEALGVWVGVTALHFPARPGLPYAREPAPATVTQRRLAVLARLALGDRDPQPPLVIASVAAATAFTARRADLGAGPGRIVVGGRIALDTLALQLVEAGYTLGPLVEASGEAARRGGILDVFPPTEALPLRIELFGDEVESIRRFDPETQRTVERLDEAVIGPAREWFPDHHALLELASRLDGSRDAAHASSELEEELAALGRGELPAASRYGPLAGDSTLFDHLGADALLIVDEEDAVLAAAAEQDELTAERARLLAREGELPAEAPRPHLGEQALIEQIEQRAPRATFSRWATGAEAGALRLPFAAHDAYAGRLQVAARELERRVQRGDRIVVVTQQAQRFRELLAEAGVAVTVEGALAAPPAPGSLALVQGSLPGGWRIATPRGELALATDRELLGFIRKRRALRRGASHRARFLADVSPGDFVVHADHGIARFAGIVRRDVGEEQRDYLQLRYAGEDRLYVPIEQIDRVSRYLADSDRAPRLTRLGTQEWARTRARVREAVGELAADLLRLYAARQLLRGHAFEADGEWQHELESAFPYEETPDQTRVIAEVKRDMEARQPMDRIVLGDVGFGKTEVAVRAAFKAVQDGYQVAILVPTTVLAQQHERTFRERLAPFPVRVETLSRFRTDTEARAVLAGLHEGSIDIVIGTHRLLQPGVEFANLGLVVIDEEQRFGVAHKERLKRMRLEVDVLTLSATPIPRTLHMTLAGIRDMSTMESAPEDRLPVQTWVAEWDDALVREAILGELERGGQAYVVHNRVHSIDQFADRLRALAPEARIVVGHGQMHRGLLRSVMERFAAGEADVLVCTTIIESGIDIPNVNTLIVDLAERLGLAQLYQLRGRVGRGSQQARAYLLHRRGGVLNEAAQQRLATIFEATELGAGLQVALRDLEIRGAGNLLGAEQSGQIAAVGFDLYTQMLATAVEGLRAKRDGRDAPAPPPPVSLDLPASAFIPERYIEDLEARIALYQRIAGLRDLREEADLCAEVSDRFGELPGPLRELLALVRIRLAAGEAGVAAVRAEGSEIVLVAREGAPFGRRNLPPLPAGVRVGQTQLRLPRAALGADWLDAIEALLRLIGEPHAATLRAPAGAVRA
ncbi:MAG: transcription-repair coupling factor [Chloroflexi bacterium]|nr:transcription-repair coupling factor [Chloroflexota bacterium]